MSVRLDVAGKESFDRYYSALFGSRWPALREALLKPVGHASWDRELLKPYFLDPGSVVAALSLPPVIDGRVLDMCAAPGGKTLVLLGRLGEGSRLTANEFSRDRKQRLITVLDEHAPAELRERVSVTGFDASRWSRYEQSCYDRILLDAPCSSERHVLCSEKHLAEWKPSRIKSLAIRQWSLLSGAWLVLAPKGLLLYSTCALDPAENDEIVRRLLKKYPDAAIREPDFDSLPPEYPRGERTLYGFHVLPDADGGAGPLYYALIEKT